ncbi:MAG: response regulator [Gammaproteobacteria bacterium]|nr:response regulator [Gammaproteobacteria bacterium]
MKLMIVDDSNIIRRKIERSTEVDGLEVVATATNGVDALEQFPQVRPDIVTMDLTMPEMGGIECVERMVEMDPNVIILVISALSDKATAIEALKKGANGFLCKPFTEDELNRAFRELLEEKNYG